MEVAPGGGVLLHLKVVPGGSKDAILGAHGDRLRVKVAAPPERGKANDAVVRFLAERLGVPRTAVRLVRGATSPLKTVAVSPADAARVRAALLGDPA